MSESPETGATAAYAWWPTENIRAGSNWQAFMQTEGLADYETLIDRASSDPQWFWDALIRFLDFRFIKPYRQVLDTSQGIEWPRWCMGGTTNMTISLLDRHIEAGRGDRIAISWEGEDGTRISWTYGQLHEETCRLAAALSALGIGKGDAVGLYMPMIPETAAAFLALARLGCVILPLFSGFGSAAIATRLNDASAKAAITVDACVRRGKRQDMITVLREAAAEVPSLELVIIADRLGTAGPLASGKEYLWFDLTEGRPSRYPATELDAEAPLMIVYTSGTTGRPKGTVHTHCGFPVKTGEDFLLCFDLKETDRLLWMTDMGWLVGPVQVTATLLAGASLVLAEGTPDYPEPGRLWQLIQDHHVTIAGIGPTVARMMMRHGAEEIARRDLRSLRLVASTGEPWDPDSWHWVFEKVLGKRGPLMNYSGGTEMGGLVATNILYPIKPTSFHGPIPGTGADIVGPSGKPVGPGEVGELVMREVCIGTTRGLWKDDERYLESYWRRIPGMWVHGDWASRDSDGAWYIHGRSDDTIKLAGKRTGPAEIEALLLATKVVSDGAAVGIPDATKGSAVVCVVVPVAGSEPGPSTTDILANAVAAGLGSAFRPKRIVYVSDLPRTRNMKVMRRVIRSVLVGEPPGDISTLVNPEAVDELAKAIASD